MLPLRDLVRWRFAVGMVWNLPEFVCFLFNVMIGLKHCLLWGLHLS